ncbi:TMV resistance protein N-like [Pyrus ussuriensis x Pyrus communis]|uniref:TMV resistance protein N-like n=1 Tax=Pyrus ussuriensis x Pyrus communis TaxID=2448454 RepID=A0A5N5HDS5_9ROSA|nr:TMV resistance protein N-like [Pyrus ussuriensis x Pyrus communis]
MVELLAVHDGVYWAVQWNLPQIIVKSDCLQVVQAIGSLKQGSSHMDLLVEDIRASLWIFEDSQVSYVCHTANVAAHFIAKLAISYTSNFCWFEEPPNLIVETLLESV